MLRCRGNLLEKPEPRSDFRSVLQLCAMRSRCFSLGVVPRAGCVGSRCIQAALTTGFSRAQVGGGFVCKQLVANRAATDRSRGETGGKRDGERGRGRERERTWAASDEESWKDAGTGPGGETFSLRGLRNPSAAAVGRLSVAGTTYLTHCPYALAASRIRASGIGDPGDRVATNAALDPLPRDRDATRVVRSRTSSSRTPPTRHASLSRPASLTVSRENVRPDGAFTRPKADESDPKAVHGIRFRYASQLRSRRYIDATCYYMLLCILDAAVVDK